MNTFTEKHPSQAVYFLAPGQVALREEKLPPPGTGQVMVQTRLSAISSGSELLIYRGQFPDDLEIDANIAALAGEFHYPLKYGYCAVGQIIQVGEGVDEQRCGQWVFAFQPHQNCFNAPLADLLFLPQGVSPQDALFLANMETAVNLVMDGKPLIGEQALVCGQGVIGLLTTALLGRFPLAGLATLDHYPLRRQASLQLGARASFDPAAGEALAQLQALQPDGADLTFELSGSPQALDQAIGLTGFAGRVVIGSWYGQKRADLHLGGRFHRSRIHLFSSQVSTLNPELSGRWNKARRFQVAWEMLRLIQPGRFITHRFPIQDAAQAYQMIDQHPEQTIQVVLTYEGE